MTFTFTQTRNDEWQIGHPEIGTVGVLRHNHITGRWGFILDGFSWFKLTQPLINELSTAAVAKAKLLDLTERMPA